MATMTFKPMSDREIAKLNDAYQAALPSSYDASAAASSVADAARLHYVRWREDGSYYKNERNELVFKTTSGFTAPPQTTFEYDEDV